MNKRLYWALGLSLVLHVAFASLVEFEPPEPPDAPKLTARFDALPAPPSAAATPKTISKTIKPVKKAPTAPTPLTPVATLPSEPMAEGTPSEPEIEKIAQAPEPQKTSEPEPPKAEPKAAPESAPEPEPPKAPKTKGRHETLPRVIDLQYATSLSRQGSYPMTVGNFTLRFTHEEGKYELATVGRARGFFAFLYPGALKMVSRGTLTENGIRPDRFSLERNDPSKTRHVVFDWEKMLATVRDKDPIPIKEPTFDALTFIIQFYFSMHKHVAGEPVTLNVVSPTRLDEYTLKREETVTLKTPLGDIDTERWVGSRKTANGKAEFWLAPKWHYIPFKVALTSEHEDTAIFSLETVATEDPT